MPAYRLDRLSRIERTTMQATGFVAVFALPICAALAGNHFFGDSTTRTTLGNVLFYGGTMAGGLAVGAVLMEVVGDAFARFRKRKRLKPLSEVLEELEEKESEDRASALERERVQFERLSVGDQNFKIWRILKHQEDRHANAARMRQQFFNKTIQALFVAWLAYLLLFSENGLLRDWC